MQEQVRIHIDRRSGSSGTVLSTSDRHEIIRAARQARSLTILNQIKRWLDAEQKLVLPRSPMAAAITYALNQWPALCAYTTAGFLNIDNNAAERALKRIAIGRKNWLFAGNDAAATSHARLYTLLASAERHGLNPQEYLTSVLANIDQTRLSELEQFLPDRWQRASQASPPAPVDSAVSKPGDDTAVQITNNPQASPPPGGRMAAHRFETRPDS